MLILLATGVFSGLVVLAVKKQRVEKARALALAKARRRHQSMR